MAQSPCFFGRLECPETAEWASKVFGDQEIEQFTTSQTHSSQGHSTTTRNQQIVVRRAVLPAEFMSVPPCDLENGLTGYFMVRSRGCFLDNLPGQSLFKGALIPPAPNVPEFAPRPVDAQYLASWNKNKRLSFCGLVREKDKMRKLRPSRRQTPDPLSDMDTI